MKQNDFYEVDGCTEFVPVTISEVYDDGVIVTVNNAKRNCMLAVEEVYLFPKVHEPQKPVVPKFVVDWIEYYKKKGRRLAHALEHAFYDDELRLYISQQEGDYTETLARAWLAYPNITVEKEKLYTVEIPNPNLNAHVVLQKTEKGVVLVTVGNARWKGWESSKLTEAEIKQDFEWALKWAKEVKR